MPACSSEQSANAETRAQVLQAYRRLVADVHELAHITRRISDREAKGLGATASQWHVLSVISDGPRTVPSIAKRLGLSRQAVQRTCAELVAAGEATITPNPSHQRSPFITASKAGLDLQERLYANSEAARLAAIDRAGLALPDLRAASEVVRTLLEALSPDGDRGDDQPIPTDE